MSGFRVVTGEFQHETNTFNRTPTTMANFDAEALLIGEQEVLRGRRGTRSGIGGVIEAAESLYEWTLGVNLVASANPTGMLTSECFEECVDALLKPLKLGRVDGVLLCLHGAMVSEAFPDAEGEILRRVRELVGPNVPIIATLDLHGNITTQMTEMSNCLLACRTYPHVDFYESAIKAAGMLHQAMQGQVKPVGVIAKRSMTHGLDRGRTFPGSPMQALIDRSESIELTDRTILFISVCAGFPAADIFDIGPSVTVTVDVAGAADAAEAAERIARGQAIAEEFMDFCWEQREHSSVNLLSIAAAVQLASDFQQAGGEPRPSAASVSGLSSPNPLVEASTTTAAAATQGALILAEITDNPGSGHYGDATALLLALVHALRPPHNLQNIAMYSIADAEAVRQGLAIGVGGCGWIEMGGRHDATLGGGPLRLYGRVVHLSDGRFRAWGPVCGGVWQNMGLSLCFRVSATDYDRVDLVGIGSGVRDTDSYDTAASTDPRCVDICLTSNKQQALDTAQMINLGADPARYSVLLLKSMNHFRADFGPLASQIAHVDGGGLGSVILGGGGSYVNVRRPIWPLDADAPPT